MAKYSSLTRGQDEALVNKLGEAFDGDGLAAVHAILAGAKVTIEEVIATFFDCHGRRIPPRGIKAAVCDANRTYHLLQPETIDYVARLERVRDAFEGKVKLPEAAWFEDAIGGLKVKVTSDSKIENALKGVHLPNVVPQMVVVEHGTTLDDVLLLALGRSYQKEFPARPFNNYRKGKLTGQTTVIEGSKLDILVERAKQGPVPLIEFPTATQGYSVHAQREQMETMPKGFILNGFNTILSAIMWPDVICRDYKTPVIDLSAYQWRGAEYSLALLSRDGFLDFDYGASLAGAGGDCSGGVSFLG
ncbi:hypothetical protein COV04_02225 [Candidatus Uhrbacteria bacterium CG10_big_fil_rev_8_21_14_0_10_48_11]|uniref:Uncharacterized protein n=1 Tax=Candidatus Uhrbacteria bacterium CG10_big_fil_rev_8_21_14_0_10_48_11 TaxID=1975037 RepID=A0A2M8LES3_9BACT|nr:MAG: hypothetical protein COV04_02225 [Candidatus Uhrbacteria bacterium CG10_big_fil_rev_8_21_14_0_10_48_11]